MGWYLGFRSLDNKACGVSIDGGGTTLTGAAEPVTFEEDSSDDLLEVIRPKTGYLNLVETSYGELDSIFPATNTERSIRVYRNNELLFFGFIQAQNYANDYAPAPRHVSLPISSPLGVIANTFINPRNSAGNTTLGAVMKEICTALGYTYIVVPTSLLTGDANPMHVSVNNRVLSPYNDNYGFGAEDLFSPMSYEDFLTAFCNLYGVIARDTIHADNGVGYPTLAFTRFDYNGTYRLMAVSSLDDTSETGTSITARVLSFTTNFNISDKDGQTSMILPLGELDIEHDDYVDEVEMNLKHSTFGSSPGSREGSMNNVGKVMYFMPLSIAAGNEFYSAMWSSDTALYTTAPTSNMVRVAGDGSQEYIEVRTKYTEGVVLADPLFTYTFGTIPRTRFSLAFKTFRHAFIYRVRVQSGGKYLEKSGSQYLITYRWVDSPTIIDGVTANTDGEYRFDDIPATDSPIVITWFCATAIAYYNDPFTDIWLETKTEPFVEYHDKRVSPLRTNKQEGSAESASISMTFHDYIDTPGRIIGGSLVAQNDYAYIFRSLRVLEVRAKRTVTNTWDEMTMKTGQFTINGVSGWRLICFGMDVWNDEYILKFMK